MVAVFYSFPFKMYFSKPVTFEDFFVQKEFAKKLKFQFFNRAFVHGTIYFVVTESGMLNQFLEPCLSTPKNEMN